jgi:serine/threonine protein kinase
MIGELERKNPEFIVPSFLDFLTCFLFKSKPSHHCDSINYYFGFIAMEYIPSNYKTFCDIIKPIIMDEIKSKPENKDIYKYDSMTLSTKSKRLRWMYNTARYDVLRLAIDTGYSQGDYHTDNILIDEKTRRCMIIDFGKAKKIYNDDNILNLNIFENTNDISNIEIILDRIFYTTFDDDKKSDEFMWLKNIDEIDIGILLFLHENRMTYIENQTFLNPL